MQNNNTNGGLQIYLGGLSHIEISRLRTKIRCNPEVNQKGNIGKVPSELQELEQIGSCKISSDLFGLDQIRLDQIRLD